jgi:uncharacterized membrane protein
VVTQAHPWPLDAPPFNWLRAAVGDAALYITALILITQRRERTRFSDLREPLNLELVITNEQKTAKVIQLLEGLRRANSRDVLRLKPGEPYGEFMALGQRDVPARIGKSLPFCLVHMLAIGLIGRGDALSPGRQINLV